MNRSDPLERTNLSTKALEFLLDLHDASQDELIGTQDELIQTLSWWPNNSGLAPPWAAAIIDGCSATFDRVVFPSLPASHFSTLSPHSMGRPILELAHRRCVRKDLSSAQTLRPTPVLTTAGVVYTSALASTRCNPLPYSATNRKALGTFIVAFRKSRASFDLEITSFGVYAMRTILQKPSYYKSRLRAV